MVHYLLHDWSEELTYSNNMILKIDYYKIL